MPFILHMAVCFPLFSSVFTLPDTLHRAGDLRCWLHHIPRHAATAPLPVVHAPTLHTRFNTFMVDWFETP